MLTELHRMAERIEKNFTIRAFTEVDADFLADVPGKLVVQIGRQPLQNLDAMPFPMPLVRGGVTGAWISAYSVRHGVLRDYTKLFDTGVRGPVRFARNASRAEFFSHEQPGAVETGFDGALVQAEDATHVFGA